MKSKNIFKQMRRAVRAAGKHPRTVETVPVAPQRVWAGLPGVGPSAIFLGQRTLQPGCGRAMYQALKKQFKRGNVRLTA